jgi:hypothetical protein
VDAGHVAREQVGGALDPAEGAADRSRERLGQRRLADPGHVFDQDVAADERGDERELDRLLLADHDLRDVLEDRRERVREGARRHRRHHDVAV